MGGGYYDRDVNSTPASSPSSGGYDYSSYSAAASAALGRSSVSDDVSPLKRKLSTDAKSPIVVAMDVTGSMGEWSKIIYDKMPMFFGQIMLQGYMKDPAISFAAVGDANCDKAPLQICDFARGTELDDWLKKLLLEGGGGGTAQESYELAGAAYAKTTIADKDATPVFFFIGDEGFYKTVPAWVAEKVLGSKESIDGDEAMKSLCAKFEVFLVHKHYPDKDAAIVRQWASVIGQERILKLDDPKAVVDVMLGALAILSSARDLDSYAVDMEGRGQTTARIGTVKDALSGYASAAGTALAKVDRSGLPTTKGGKDNKGKGKKL